MLIFSLWRRDAAHRGVGYIVGALDVDAAAERPVFTSRCAGILDTGSSFYAPQAVASTGADGAPARALLWGWAQEVAPSGVRSRTQTDNDAHGWSGLLTFPRELVVAGDVVESVPARELTALRDEPVDAGRLPDQAELVLGGVGTAELRLGAGGTTQTIWRGELSGEDEVRILVDASIVEVFTTGRPAETYRAYPEDDEAYALVHDDGVSVAAWHLALPVPGSD
ncbi:MAG: GH32 C-terminal domain-containing protein [Microbacterium arborescens]